MKENDIEYHRLQLLNEKPFQVELRGINHDSDLGITLYSNIFQTNNIASDLNIKPHNVILRFEYFQTNVNELVLFKSGKSSERQLKSLVEERNIIPKQQFEFQNKHLIIDHLHSVTYLTNKVFEKKYYYETLNKFLHKELITKLFENQPHNSYALIESYLTNISAEVQQDNIIEAFMCLFYTDD
ncbi:Reverse transcriptase domain-containing protein [Aphis craccivora]|uniref:Reverse transcriptase domain-containing protein n=1 Tax=Aphis craccivora TaxID=307492 RepID=A0A6G0Y3Z3_APHCR|nr:Reverse transcriptase domain-containing protein [Aphis craccivora]